MSTTYVDMDRRAAAITEKMSDKMIFEALELVDRKDADHRLVEVMLRTALIDRNICPDGRGHMDEELNCRCCK